MSYFTTLTTQPGFNTLSNNPCNLLDFQLVVLREGESVSGNTAEREVLAVILGGAATFAVGKQRFEKLGNRSNVFSGLPTSVYIPLGLISRSPEAGASKLVCVARQVICKPTLTSSIQNR